MKLQENDWLKNYLSLSYKYRNGIGVQLKQKEQRRARNVVEQGQAGYILHTLHGHQFFLFSFLILYPSKYAGFCSTSMQKLKLRFWDYEELSNWCTHFEKFPFENIFNMILWSSLSASKLRLKMPNLRGIKKNPEVQFLSNYQLLLTSILPK